MADLFTRMFAGLAEKLVIVGGCMTARVLREVAVEAPIVAVVWETLP